MPDDNASPPDFGDPSSGDPSSGAPSSGDPSSGKPVSVSPIDQRVLLRGNRFDVYAMDLRGRDGKIVTREVIRHAGAVVILPILDADTIVMIRNTRPTVGETLLELPAGTREPGESAVETARRELTEETGYRGETFTPLHEFYSAPGICDERMTLFVAENLAAGDANLESTEQITNRLVSAEEVAGLISRGEIRDAKTLVGLYAFLARRTR